MIYNVQTVRTKNTEKVDNLTSAHLGTTGVVSTLVFSPQIRLAESGSHPDTALWDPVTFPAAGWPPTEYHGPTIPTVASPLGGRGAWDQLNN